MLRYFLFSDPLTTVPILSHIAGNPVPRFRWSCSPIKQRLSVFEWWRVLTFPVSAEDTTHPLYSMHPIRWSTLIGGQRYRMNPMEGLFPAANDLSWNSCRLLWMRTSNKAAVLHQKHHLLPNYIADIITLWLTFLPILVIQLPWYPLIFCGFCSSWGAVSQADAVRSVLSSQRF